MSPSYTLTLLANLQPHLHLHGDSHGTVPFISFAPWHMPFIWVATPSFLPPFCLLATPSYLFRLSFSPKPSLTAQAGPGVFVFVFNIYLFIFERETDRT